MKKKLLFSLLFITVLFITGCGSEGVKTADGKTEYTCIKNGIDDSIDSNGTKMNWKKDITYTAKLDDDGKLTYYSFLTHYMYNSSDDCNYWCDVKTKWNDEINSKNYTGGHRETNCACDKKELDEKYVYDDIPNLASILRSDIRELKSDNTFGIDSWLERFKKANYNCN